MAHFASKSFYFYRLMRVKQCSAWHYTLLFIVPCTHKCLAHIDLEDIKNTGAVPKHLLGVSFLHHIANKELILLKR